MNITTRSTKWGNSTGVRLPQKVVKAAGIKPDQELLVTVKNNSVILTPIDKESFTLDDMLKGVTPEKVQGEVNWGEAVGAEIVD